VILIISHDSRRAMSRPVTGTITPPLFLNVNVITASQHYHLTISNCRRHLAPEKPDFDPS